MAEGLSLAHRAWRALPRGPRRTALSALASALAPRADATPPESSPAMLVAGELGQGTGLGEAARIMADAVEVMGFGAGRVAVGVGKAPRGAVAPDAALLLMVNAPSLPLMLARAGRGWLRGRRVIGSWAWDLPVAPRAWAQGARYVHEVWVPSPFVAEALAPVFPGHVRLVPYPMALRGLAPAMADRHGFGLPEDAVVTVMVFALGSSFSRKNPLAGIAAFKRAFGNRPDQVLVVKFSGAGAYPREAALIAAQAAPNIRIFSESWPCGRVESLLETADIVLSLHRAEGFGLVPAEAMLRGKPVVATGWSGNMAYMDAESAALVDYRLVPVKDTAGLYEAGPGAMWAEPDVEGAAVALRRLGDDAVLRAELGIRAQTKARDALGDAPLRAALAANGVVPKII